MARRDFLRLEEAGLTGAMLLGASDGRACAQKRASLKKGFGAASRDHGVLAELLSAMGYYSTRSQRTASTPSATTRRPARPA